MIGNKKKDSKYKISQAELATMHSEALDATIGPASEKSRSHGYEEMQLDDTFSFGKYKGYKTLAEVIKEAPWYVEWVLTNTNRPISEEALDLLEELEGQ